jgi:hypothetical protein
MISPIAHVNQEREQKVRRRHLVRNSVPWRQRRFLEAELCEYVIPSRDEIEIRIVADSNTLERQLLTCVNVLLDRNVRGVGKNILCSTSVRPSRKLW